MPESSTVSSPSREKKLARNVVTRIDTGKTASDIVKEFDYFERYNGYSKLGMNWVN